jgi:hypothetical protein
MPGFARQQIIGMFRVLADGFSSWGTDGIDKRGYSHIGLIIPTVTSGSLGFQVSTDNSTWVPLTDVIGTVLNLGTTTGSLAISSASLQLLAPWSYVKLTTGASQTTTGSATWMLAT